MVPSAEIMAFIKARESCRLDPHWDAIGGVWDIGYGHVLGPNDRRVSITQDEADALFEMDCRVRADELSTFLPELPQQIFDALVSLSYNVGVQAVRDSTIVGYLNRGAAGDLEAACIAFLDWNKAQGRFVQGLLNRRALEMLIFARGEYR